MNMENEVEMPRPEPTTSTALGPIDSKFNAPHPACATTANSEGSITLVPGCPPSTYRPCSTMAGLTPLLSSEPAVGPLSSERGQRWFNAPGVGTSVLGETDAPHWASHHWAATARLPAHARKGVMSWEQRVSLSTELAKTVTSWSHGATNNEFDSMTTLCSARTANDTLPLRPCTGTETSINHCSQNAQSQRTAPQLPAQTAAASLHTTHATKPAGTISGTPLCDSCTTVHHKWPEWEKFCQMCKHTPYIFLSVRLLTSKYWSIS